MITKYNQVDKEGMLDHAFADPKMANFQPHKRNSNLDPRTNYNPRSVSTTALPLSSRRPPPIHNPEMVVAVDLTVRRFFSHVNEEHLDLFNTHAKSFRV